MKANFLLSATLMMSVATLTKCSKGGNTDSPPPVANFSYTGGAMAPATVSFTNSSSNAYTYTWDFGDNKTSFDKSPSHNYTQGGTYTVKLTATGSSGTTSTTKTVN